jgi:class 3 adenylate cyclase
MEPQIRYTTTDDGASIAYAVMGAGPVVIMAPSVYQFTGRLRAFPSYGALVEAMARQFTVVLYDGRGMGLSSRERRDFGLEARLRDLDAVVRAAGADNFSLYGQSMSGLPVMAYAARHAEHVACMVVQDSFLKGERFYRDNRVGRVLDALGAVAAEHWQVVTDMLGSRFVPDDADPGAARGAAALLRESWDGEAFMEFREAGRQIDAPGELGSISVPTLVVATDGSVFEHSRELASAIPNARLLRVQARWAGWDERDYAALTEFLAEHAQAIAPAPASVPSPAVLSGSSVRTVLFTDLVGHTEMMQRLGDARGREVLREHERITRETLRAHGGDEIKTMGDGFLASFGSVTSAVDCAIALQRAFATHTESMSEPLHVRVGLNAGEPIEEDGDLFGSTVILASRIAANAGTGEILIPESVRGLLSGKQFLFSDRGEFVPKGFEDGVRLFEVRWRE